MKLRQTFLLLLSALCFSGHFAIAQNKVAIEDLNFEKALIDLRIDKGTQDGFVSIDDIKTLTVLNISGREISNIKGIEHFESLESLDCSDNSIASLDLSNNLKLNTLLADNNLLESLDASKNVGLKNISVRSNKLKVLVVKRLKKLSRLYCQENLIQDLDLSGNEGLAQLYASSNELKTLDLSRNPLLSTVFVDRNALISINLKNGKNDTLFALDISGNPNLICVLVDSDFLASKQFQWKKDKQTSYDDKGCNLVKIADRNFEMALISMGYDYETNGYVSKSRIESIKKLNLSSKAIESLSGIENFEALEILDFSSNKVEDVDLSKNKNLKEVYGRKNKLKTLNLRGLSSSLAKLDVSENPTLPAIEADSETTPAGWVKDPATEIASVIEYVSLTVPELEKNLVESGIDNAIDGRLLKAKVAKIEEIDLSNIGLVNVPEVESFYNLKRINLSGNKITQVNLESNPKLEGLNLKGNAITKLDLTKNKSLKILDVSSNDLSALNIKDLDSVKVLNLSSNPSLQALDLSTNKSLESVDITQNPALSCVFVGNLPADKLKLLKSDKFSGYTSEPCKYIEIDDANFEKALIALGYDLGVPDGRILENAALKIENLNVSGYNIKRLSSINAFRNIVDIDCSSNGLESLDVSGLASLKKINASKNQLKSLDLSKNNNLNAIDCSQNSLYYLDLMNGNSNNIAILNTKDNPDLGCVLVDEALHIPSKSWTADPNVGFRPNCDSVEISDANFEKALFSLKLDTKIDGRSYLYVLEGIETLNLSGKNISVLPDMSLFKSLRVLNISNNDISKADFSKNQYLQTLDLSKNKIEYLDVSANTMLESLRVKQNSLKDINIKKANGGSPLKELDIRDNPDITCILVTKLADVTSSWKKSSSSIFVESCDFIQIEDDKLEKALVKAGVDIRVDGKLYEKSNKRDRLNLSNAGITSLKGLEVFADLVELNISGNKISNIDLTKFNKLKTLNASKNLITEFNLPKVTSLHNVDVSYNAISVLDFRGATNFKLENLNASNNPDLKCVILDDPSAVNTSQWKVSKGVVFTADCLYTDIPDGNFEKALVDLGIDLSGLDGRLYSGHKQPTELNLSNRNIYNLKGLETFADLVELNISGNKIKEIDVSKYNKLTTLNVSKNLLTEFVLPKVTSLHNVDVSYNAISVLDFRGATDFRLENLNASNNPDLKCVILDDPSAVNTSQWKVSKGVVFTADCLYTDIPDGNFEKALVDLGIDLSGLDGRLYSGHKQPTELNLADRNISDLSGIEVFKDLKRIDLSKNPNLNIDLKSFKDLEDIDVSYTAISNVDLSAHTDLKRLNVSATNTSSLDLSKNVQLEYLMVSNNSLVELDLSKNSLLRYLDASGNKISSLDVSANKNLTELLLSDNNINSLDLKNLNIKHLDIRDNPARCVYVSSLKELVEVSANWLDSGSAIYTETNCDIIEISDSKFEQALIDLGYDIGKPNGYIFTDKVKTIKRLDVPGREITDLTGIDKFSALTSIDVSGNDLSYVDFRSNQKLEVINVARNNLTFIDVSQNKLLNILSVQGNNLSELDVSKNANLEQLYCYENRILAIDLGANEKLKYLYAYSNRLADVNLSKNPLLSRVFLQWNELSTLNLKNGNQSRISILNVSGNYGLFCVAVDDVLQTKDNSSWIKEKSTEYSDKPCGNIIASDVNFEKALIELGIDKGDPDGIIPIGKVAGLTTLDVSGKGIKDLRDIKYFISLKKLDCSNNQIKSLDLTRNTELVELNCRNNDMTEINIASNRQLRSLDCSTNRLRNLDIENFYDLEYLDAHENEIFLLDLSKNESLKEVYVQVNNLSALNVSNNSALSKLNAKANKLASVNIANSNNSGITYLDLTQNDFLNCIIVDNVEVANKNQTWSKPDGASYSEVDGEACNYIIIPDSKFETYLVKIGLDDLVDGKALRSKLSSAKTLDVSNGGITDIQGIHAFEALEVLNCSTNYITRLDLSANENLQQVNCSNNQIIEILFSKDNVIETIEANSNKIEQIDLLGAQNLESIDLNSNNLTYLDLSHNTKVKKVYLPFNTRLTGIDLQNKNNLGLADLDVTQNPSLKCVLVDSPAEASKNKLWKKDKTATFFSGTCDIVKIPDINFEKALIALKIESGAADGEVMKNKLVSIKQLDISGRGIQNLSGIEAFSGLEILKASKNAILEVDLSSNVNLQRLDISKNSLTSLVIKENKNLKEVDASNNKIEDIEFPEFFSIEKLNVSSNQLRKLFSRRFVKLKELRVDHNSLVELDLSGSNDLESLTAKNNKLTTVDIKNGFNSKLKTVNLTANPDLFCIAVDDQAIIEAASKPKSTWKKDANANYSTYKCYAQITDPNFEKALVSYDNMPSDGRLPIARIKDLKDLNVSGLDIQDLSGIEHFLALQTLDCSKNKIQNLSLINQLELTRLDCSKNSIAELNLSQNVKLESLTCDYNSLDQIDLSSNALLQDLNCSYNGIEQLNLSKNTKLSKLKAHSNKLEYLNLGNAESIVSLDVSDNKELFCIQVGVDVIGKTSHWIKDTYAGYSSDGCKTTAIEDPIFEGVVGALGLDGRVDGVVLNTSLETIKDLNVANMHIKSLQGIEAMTNLETVDASKNDLKKIDLSNNKKLARVNLSDNKLEFLTIKNKNNKSISSFNSKGNKYLQCLIVDDILDLKANKNWKKDVTSVYTSDMKCQFVSITSPTFEQVIIDLGYDSNLDGQVLLANVEKLEQLHISDKNITDLGGIEWFKSLKVLDCSKNLLQALDVSKLQNLESLNCAENQITNLNIESNKRLAYLFCESNKIKDLNVSKNEDLQELYCFSNQIANLDLSGNKQLRYVYAYLNNIQELNLANNTVLSRLFIKGNKLTYLNIKSRFNTNITTLDVTENPKLNCIEVDSPKNAESYVGWKKDAKAKYVERCKIDI